MGLNSINIPETHDRRYIFDRQHALALELLLPVRRIPRLILSPVYFKPSAIYRRKGKKT